MDFSIEEFCYPIISYQKFEKTKSFQIFQEKSKIDERSFSSLKFYVCHLTWSHCSSTINYRLFLSISLPESEERKDHMYENGVEATVKFNKEDRAFAKKWGIPLEERRHNMSIYGTWIYRDNITVIPERTWIPIEDLNRTMFDKLAELNLDEPFGYTPLFMRK